MAFARPCVRMSKRDFIQNKKTKYACVGADILCMFEDEVRIKKHY